MGGPPPIARQLLGLAGWLALCFTAALLGGLASVNAPEFYARLDQPAWAPPAWLFGPVWTTLYVLMAVSAWLVWRARGLAGARVALGLFVVQLALNALWSWLFFVWHRGAWAYVGALMLALLVAATAAAFQRTSTLAAALLLPYLAWVSFATALTYALWSRNPGVLG